MSIYLESTGPRQTTAKRAQTMEGISLGERQLITSFLNVGLTRKKEES